MEAIRLDTLAHLEDSDNEEACENLQENIYFPVSAPISNNLPQISQAKFNLDVATFAKQPAEDIPQKRRKVVEDDSRVSEVVRSPDSSQNREENEFDVFGKYVAIQLQRLPIENALELEAQIHQLITETRLKIIRSSNQRSNSSENFPTNYEEEFSCNREFLEPKFE